MSLAFPVVLGFLIAYAMRARAVYFPTLLRTAIFFPVTMSLVAVGLMFLLILNPIFGAFDSVLRALGLGFLVREWFGDYRIAIYTLAVVGGWAFTGLPMIFYFAGIGDVPKETFDAARIEGAGHLRMMLRVALPQLRPVTAVVVMLTLFKSFKAFDLIAVMTKGAPFGRTNVLGYLVYLESFWNSRFGYGATVSVAISCCRSLSRVCCSASCSRVPSMSSPALRSLRDGRSSAFATRPRRYSRRSLRSFSRRSGSVRWRSW